MRLAILSLAIAALSSTGALAARIDRPETTRIVKSETVKVADTYRGKKHCRKVGSAEVCN